MRCTNFACATLRFTAALFFVHARPAMAAQEIQGNQRTFEAAFFTPYAPTNALEMVNRVPGFALSRNQGARGFASNAGNVLIDGVRPATKEDDISLLLSRIPAAQVLKIELLAQAEGASDLAGKSQVINLILRTTIGMSGTYKLGAIGTQQQALTLGALALSAQRAQEKYGFNIDLISAPSNSVGPERVVAAENTLQQTRQYQSKAANSTISIGATVASNFSGMPFNAQLKHAINRSRFARSAAIFDGSQGRIANEQLLSRSPDSAATTEIGVDLERTWEQAAGAKAVALYRRTNEEITSFNARTEIAASRTTERRTRSDNFSDEAIFRLQNYFTVAGAQRVQYGVEVARNRLRARFVDRSASVVVPASTVDVRELRYEPFVSSQWQPTKGWHVEAGLTGERSTIEVTPEAGAQLAANQRSLSYIKPRMLSSWTLNPSTDVELEVERSVAQLNFLDFATDVDLENDGQVDAGNTALVPERVWSMAGTFRKRFWQRASTQLLLSYERVQDTQDFIPITTRDSNGNVSAVFDGPGNIGNSQRWNLEFDLLLPMDAILKAPALQGFELKIVSHYHGSQVTDPLTGRIRLRSQTPEFHHSVGLRQDIPDSAWKWGASTAWFNASETYFTNQITRVTQQPFVSLFAEYRGLSSGVLRFDVIDALGVNQSQQRQFYSGTRATGTFSQRFQREQAAQPRFQLTWSNAF
jgi:hypothetical protein